jgi:DNA-binding LacI/PurR family transcriptional regulator
VSSQDIKRPKVALVWTMVRWMGSEMFNSIEEYLSEANCDILFKSSRHDHQKEYEILNELLDTDVNGIVLYSTGHPDNFRLTQELMNQGKSVVLLDRYFVDQSNDHGWVTSENEQGAYEMTRYLIELGHTRIGMIIQTPEHQFDRISTIVERERGYVRAMNEAGLESMLLKTCTVFEDSGAAICQALSNFINSRQPTALFFHNDVSAYRMHAVLTRNGMRVPQDISIAGFDGLKLFYDILSFDLTTVRQDFTNLGQEVGKLVLSLMQNPDHQPRQIRLPVKLHIGNTTAPPRTGIEPRKREIQFQDVE